MQSSYWSSTAGTEQRQKQPSRSPSWVRSDSAFRSLCKHFCIMKTDCRIILGRISATNELASRLSTTKRRSLSNSNWMRTSTTKSWSKSPLKGSVASKKSNRTTKIFNRILIIILICYCCASALNKIDHDVYRTAQKTSE